VRGRRPDVTYQRICLVVVVSPVGADRLLSCKSFRTVKSSLN
jgi:hypothetical protein